MTAAAQRRDGSAQKLESEMHTTSSNVSSQTALEPIVAPLRLEVVEERKHSQRARRQATMGGLSRAALAETRARKVAQSEG